MRSMSRPSGVTLSLGSRRSMPFSVKTAAASHASPSPLRMTRSVPSWPGTCLSPSRKVQYHWSWERTRRVKALCGARSQILRTDKTSARSAAGVTAATSSNTAIATRVTSAPVGQRIHHGGTEATEKQNTDYPVIPLLDVLSGPRRCLPLVRPPIRDYNRHLRLRSVTGRTGPEGAARLASPRAACGGAFTVPRSIFLDFNLPNATTWFYLSLLLAVALFYQFHRLLSLRNWDLVTLFMLVPG